MELSNLKARPDKFKDTLALIEKSFGYQAPNLFDVDFYPLMKKENRENCHILLVDGEVAAHTGFVIKQFEIKKEVFPVLFIGGVAVDEKHRGLGLSTRLLKDIFETFPQAALYILWSDKTDLYKKLSFHPCIELYEEPQEPGESAFQQVQITSLSNEDITRLKELYSAKDEIRVLREEADWEAVKQISSSQFFIKRNQEKITNYFFMNKGQDLGGVIHEYGNLCDRQEMLSHGRLWSSQKRNSSLALFGALARPGSLAPFKDFVGAFTDGKIKVESVDKEISFQFEEKIFSLAQAEFLQGIFGPGRFEELSSFPRLFISGLDSI